MTLARTLLAVLSLAVAALAFMLALLMTLCFGSNQCIGVFCGAVFVCAGCIWAAKKLDGGDN